VVQVIKSLQDPLEVENNLPEVSIIIPGLQCFDTVGWAAGKGIWPVKN